MTANLLLMDQQSAGGNQQNRGRRMNPHSVEALERHRPNGRIEGQKNKVTRGKEIELDRFDMADKAETVGRTSRYSRADLSKHLKVHGDGRAPTGK